MAVYRKKLVDKDGNTIIPAIGDIYGLVYTASLQSASGGVATYTFTPDTPVEANRVYAVKFPTPTVNNAVILLGDGNMTASSILLPPVAASDSPSYELAYTYNINDTEVWLLMYNGSNQWVCLNQKRSVSSGDIDWTTQSYTVTLGQHIESYSEVTVKSFGGIATIKGFLVTNAVVAQGEALFTISNCPDALKNQRIVTTGAAGIPYYYIDYTGKAFYDIGSVPVGNILFGVAFI